MATTDQIWARTPLNVTEVTVKNTHASTDIAAGDVVTSDAANNPLSTTAPYYAVVQGTTDDYPFGVAVEAIPHGSYGRVQTFGFVQCVASAAITAGALVQADANGKVKTQVATKAQLGQAMSTSSGNNDLVMIKLAIARNA